jgi:hypothetical protein
VYWNITKKVWSVRDKSTGRVVLRLPCLRLDNCKFVVQPGGRARVLREKQKNIHAFVEGELDCCGTADGALGVFADMPDGTKGVTYNPYKHETFVLREGETPIHEAPVVILTRVYTPGQGYKPCVEAA